jgi:hypothetical protein
VKNTDDGMLVEFPSVVDAVRCAAEVQRAMVDRNADTAEDKRIAFRVGVNLGDVIAEAEEIYGDGVNIAARLEALAEPGGICISRVVRDQIRDKLPYPFEDMGEQTVKNIARPGARLCDECSCRCLDAAPGRASATRCISARYQPPAFPNRGERDCGNCDWGSGLVGMAKRSFADCSCPVDRDRAPAKPTHRCSRCTTPFVRRAAFCQSIERSGSGVFL